MTSVVPTILIIDNDDSLVAAVVARLEGYGYCCVKASTGAQGVAVFSEQRIDLVITDLNMPGGNGIALARALRATSMVPIIVVTGFHDDFGRELRTIPNLTVLDKPFCAQQLIDVVEADLVMVGATIPQDSRAKRW